MNYYRDLDSRVHCLESTAYEHMLPVGSVRITSAEAAVLQAPSEIDVRYLSVGTLYAKYQSKLYGGYTSSALGTPHIYSTTEEARNDLFAALSLGTSGTFVCIDKATGIKGDPIHTNAQFFQIGEELAAAKRLLLRTFYTNRDLIMEAVDNTALDLALANGLAALEAIVTV